MKIIDFEEIEIAWASIRTNNANEMNPATAKTDALHQHFDEHVDVDHQSSARACEVYYHYKSDASGEFSVLSSVDKVTSLNVK